MKTGQFAMKTPNISRGAIFSQRAFVSVVV